MNKVNKALSVCDIKAPIGPLIEGYYQRASQFGYLTQEDEDNGTKDDTGAGMTELIRHMLFNVTSIPTDPKKYTRSAKYIPGSTFYGQIGPRDNIDVMVISTIADDTSSSTIEIDGDVHSVHDDVLDLLLGSSLDILAAALAEAGIPGPVWKSFYVTNIVKFPRIDAGRKKTIPAQWKKDCAHLLEQEIRVIKPKVILCLGTESSKLITGFPVTKAISTIFDYKIDDEHGAKVVCAIDPKGVLRNPEVRPLFMGSLELLKVAMAGNTVAETDRSGYRYIDNEKELSILVDELIAEGITDFAIDTEWGGGRHYLDYGCNLRTIQLAWSDKDCAIVILRRCGMKNAFRPFISSATTQLRRLLNRPEVRFIGHGLSADFPMLKEAGLDMSSQIYFDTMLASHLFEPTMSHSLEDLSTKHLAGWSRQDFPLTEWKDKNKGLVTDKTAYAHVPDELLHPYSGDDAIATYRLCDEIYRPKFEESGQESLRDLFYTLVMPALLPLINIEMNGVLMDADRLVSMGGAYRGMADVMIDRFRTRIGEPHFNPNSSIQKVKLLYGTLGLDPIKTTDDPPLLWEEVEDQGLVGKVTPSTDGESLEILSGISVEAGELHEISLLSTTIRNNLCPPELNDITGNYEYAKGFLGHIKPDGRVHTRISQMLKTGRLASLEPNIMNIANKQEVAVQAVFGRAGVKVPKLRSAFMAGLGSMIIVADYKQAEIAALAYLSGDETLIASVVKGEDIHSAVCIRMFNLDCTVEEVKKLHGGLRVAAKSIVFGLLYGRGAKAISREVEKAGVPCSVDQAQEFIDYFMSQFPKVRDLIARTHKQVEEDGVVETAWGRRAFYPKMDTHEYRRILAGQKRKAFNLLIQGYVGDLLRKALINFHNYGVANPEVRFKIILTVHDSIMAEVPNEWVELVAEEVFPLCMSELAICDRLPFKVSIDVDVCARWDEDVYYSDMLARGFSEKFAQKYSAKDDDGELIDVKGDRIHSEGHQATCH